MHIKEGLVTTALFTLLLFLLPVDAGELFLAEINADNINIRSDSTVNSEIICTLHKGDRLEIISESYGWYKIKLPKTAPAFVKKSLVSQIDATSAKVLKDAVNVRLRPEETSVIIGKADRAELINILGDKGEWYRISPVEKSFGWVHQKFVNKINSSLKNEGKNIRRF